MFFLSFFARPVLCLVCLPFGWLVPFGCSGVYAQRVHVALLCSLTGSLHQFNKRAHCHSLTRSLARTRVSVSCNIIIIIIDATMEKTTTGECMQTYPVSQGLAVSEQSLMAPILI